MYRFLGVVVSVVLVLFAAAGTASAVVDGTVAGPGPNGEPLDFIGRLLIDGQYACTATLIGRESVMTARHCLVGVGRVDRVSVQFGSTDLINDPTSTTVGVSRYVESDRSYLTLQGKDAVVVLRLSNPVLDVRPARVARRDDGEFWRKGRDVYGLGWGYINEGQWSPRLSDQDLTNRTGRVLSQELRTADLRIVDQTTLAPRGMLKAFPNGSARMAPGDSGGPLVTADRFGPLVIGVLSGGLAETPYGDSTYYMKTGVDPLFDREISQGNLPHPEDDPAVDVLYGRR